MNRSLAYLATGICAAPLLALAGMMLTRSLTRGGSGSDQAIAQGYASILGGIAFAVVGGAVLWYLARQFVPERQTGVLLAADVLVLVIGVVIMQRIFANPAQLTYADATPMLQVEVRVPQDVLRGEQVDAVVSIDFAGGADASVPHPELARPDGNAVVLPWETTPIRVNEWKIRVGVRDAELMFDLPLAKVPAAIPDWSAWMTPAADTAGSARGVTLRYRYQVISHGR